MSNIIRNMVLAVIALALVSLSARNFSGAATTTSTAPARHFYLSKTSHDGSHVLGSCASGYHVASVWEILDPTVLTYNRSLGLTLADSGSGPPTLRGGWVRTGFVADPADFEGNANCNAWTSNSSADQGTDLGLAVPGSPSEDRMGPWIESNPACSSSLDVWCVEN
jgi:hypothetical protein